MTTMITYSLDIVGIVLSCVDPIEPVSHVALAKEVGDFVVVFTEDGARAMVFRAVASLLAFLGRAHVVRGYCHKLYMIRLGIQKL